MAFIQALSPGNTGAVSAGTISQAATITAGSNVLVCVQWDAGAGAGPITGVADSSGSYTAPASNQPGTNPDGQRQAWFYKANHPGGSVTITATLGFNSEYRNILVVEYGGTTGALNKFSAAAATASGTGTDAATSGAQTTDVDGCEILGVYWRIIGTGSITAGTSFTIDANGSPTGVWTERRVQASQGSVAATFTQDADNGYTAAMFAFAPAGGGGGNANLFVGKFGALLKGKL